MATKFPVGDRLAIGSHQVWTGGRCCERRRGGAVVTPEGGVRPRNSRSSRSGGSALVLAPILPNFVTPLCFSVLELPRVDQISDIVWQLAEKEDRLNQLAAKVALMLQNHAWGESA